MEKTYHFIGIGGIGMSALASFLIQKNKKVKGSDIKSNQNIENLKKDGASIQIGHLDSFISNEDIIVVSSAIDPKNEEFIKAKKLNLKILHRSDLLDEIMKENYSILVTGTHGKTSTTSLLTDVLFQKKLDPSFIIGGILKSKNTNGHFGKGNYFLAEADESDGSFLKSKAKAAIVTNLEKEHLNYWKTFDNLKIGFEKFFSNISDKKKLFWCIDDKNLASINPDGVSYGFSKKAKLQINNVRYNINSTVYDLNFLGKTYKDIEINSIGNHSALNSAAVFGLCLELDIDQETIREAFKNFQGVKRRLEKIDSFNEINFIDDYAHHPTEIKASLEAIKTAEKEKKILCIFQPHRYSRLIDLLDEFVSSFDSADELIITNIYDPHSKDLKKKYSKIISEEKLVKLIKKRSLDVKHIPDELLEDYLSKNILPFDNVVSLSAGDLSSKIKNILPNLKKSKKKLTIGIIFGGRSLEHEISLLSTKNYSSFFDKTLYDLKFFKISKKGFWSFETTLNFSENIIDNSLNKKTISLNDKNISISKQIQKNISKNFISDENIEVLPKNILAEINSCNAIFPILHGQQGEDGMIASFLKTLNIPYIGCNYSAAAICQDKAICKILVKTKNILVADFMQIFEADWKSEKVTILKNILKTLKFPIYVKPNHLGSSIGINVCNSENDLIKAIEKAFLLDSSIIVENKIFGRELQTSLLGNDEIIVGDIGEIFTQNDFFDYEKKYNKDSKISSKVPADLNEKIKIKIKNAAKDIYKILKVNSFARIDFFLDIDNNIYFNEINPIPGFSSENSLFPKMLNSIGISNEEMINKFVKYAIDWNRKTEKQLSLL